MNNNNFKKKPLRPTLVTLPFVVSGKDYKGNEYDAESCKEIMNELQKCGCFEMLTVSASVKRRNVMAGDKGVITIARIQSYNIMTGTVELFLYGKNAEFLQYIKDGCVVPHVRLEKNSNTVSNIVSFEILPAMEEV